jgi:peptide/nickel transport system substrate-binding protein
MIAPNRAFIAALLFAAAGFCADAEARTLRWARSIDATSLDPHAANTGPNLLLLHQIYEPLILRRSDGKMVPALALTWELTRDPTIWEFKLRPDAAFHDGSAFDADDVVFSLDRARSEGSDMRSLLSSVERVVKVDGRTVRVRTKGPDPLLPNNLTDILVVDQAWAERHGAVRPAGAGQNPAARSANGTGPYALVSREPGIRTVLRRNEAYWGRGEAPLDIEEIVFRPIPDGRARVEALLSGEVDFVQDVPVGQIARLSEMRDIRLNSSPENRSVFLGLNVGAPTLRSSDVRGRNPFADRRVREALNLAIDREALRRGVMQEQSAPAGVIVPPFSNGYTDALDRVPPPDPARVRALLAEAGYPDGFAVTLRCTNDRYLSDAELCRAIAEMLTNVGVRTKPQTWPAAQHFPALRRAELDLYLLGWGVSTFDSEYIFSLLYHTNAGDLGSWNGTGFSDGEVDAQIRSLRSEIGASRRNLTVARLWERLKAETIYVPLHNQIVTYAMRRAFDIPADVSNQPKIKYVGPPGT